MACGFRSAGNWCCLKITPQSKALTKAKLPFPRSVINVLKAALALPLSLSVPGYCLELPKDSKDTFLSC